MFPFRRKSKKNPNPNASWATYAVIGIIAIAALSNIGKKLSGEPAPVIDSVKEAANDIKQKNFVNIQGYKNKIFPRYTSSLNTKDLSEGTGNPALCGQSVSIAYQAFGEDDKPLNDEATEEKPLTFQLGDGTVIPAFEQGVLGVKKGGKRSLFSPPRMAYGNKKFAREDIAKDAPIRFDVTLLSLSPDMPSLSETPFRVMDTKHALGTGLSCGEEATLHMTLWSLDGRKLYSTKDKDHKPVKFTLGKSEVFLGLEQGALGLAHGGKRTLIIPPALFKTMSGKPPSIDFPLPANQTVLVDIESVP